MEALPDRRYNCFENALTTLIELVTIEGDYFNEVTNASEGQCVEYANCEILAKLKIELSVNIMVI